MKTLSLLAVTLVLSFTAAAAQGATISMEISSSLDRYGATYESVVSRLEAAAGETNAVEVRLEAERLLVRDLRVPVVAGAGCSAAADGWVECRSPRPSLVPNLHFGLGDGDDSLHALSGSMRATLQVNGGDGADRLIVDAAVPVVLRGEAGRDFLQGGPMSDTLAGGSGADELHGGAGDDSLAGFGDNGLSGFDQPDVIDGGPGERDVVSYRMREDALTVDLATGRGGMRGEDSFTDVEGVTGGSRGDHLRGTDGADTIDGGFSDHDLVEGLGGDDTLSVRGEGSRLVAGEGDDDVAVFSNALADAGPGDDTVRGFSLDQPVVCGPGRDTVVTMSGTHELPLAALDCERFVTPLFTLTALRAAGDGVALVARAGYPEGSSLCGVRAFARDPVSGRELARTAAKVSDRRRRTLTLTTHGTLPASVVIELRAQRCDRRGRLRLASRQPIVRVPLHLGAPVG